MDTNDHKCISGLREPFPAARRLLIRIC